MMAASMQGKRCSVCGTDVSQAKRTKDAAGRYYCAACVQTAQQQSDPVGRSTTACQNCGQAFGALQHSFEWKGHKVCGDCRDTLEREAVQRDGDARAAADAEKAQVEARQEEKRKVLHNTRGRQVTIVVTAVVWVMTLASFLMLLVVTDSMFRWMLAVFGTLGVLSGTACVTRYRKFAAGSPTTAADDFKAAVNLLVVQRARILILWALLSVSVVVLLAGVAMVIGKYGIAVIIGTVIALLVPVIIIGMLLERALGRECPHCRTSGSVVFDGVVDLGEQVITTRTHETSTVHDPYNQYGPPIATIRTPVEKTRVYRRQRRAFHCTACGHQWSK